MSRGEVTAVARLEMGEVLRSRWLWIGAAVYAVPAAVFVLVGLRESSVLGFTGMGRVLLSLSHALVLLLPLLALTATAQVINGPREDGTLELLFSLPLGRGSYLTGVALVRLAALVVPLWLLVLALGAGGRLFFASPVPWAYLLRTLAVSAALLFAYTGVGLALSTLVRNRARAMLYALGIWALSVALLDFALIGLMLQWRLPARLVFALAAVNPVEVARLALLAGADPELSSFGPVGFFLATRLGPAGLLWLGLGWPLVVGLGALATAARAFRRGDLL